MPTAFKFQYLHDKKRQLQLSSVMKPILIHHNVDFPDCYSHVGWRCLHHSMYLLISARKQEFIMPTLPYHEAVLSKLYSITHHHQNNVYIKIKPQHLYMKATKAHMLLLYTFKRILNNDFWDNNLYINTRVLSDSICKTDVNIRWLSVPTT